MSAIPNSAIEFAAPSAPPRRLTIGKAGDVFCWLDAEDYEWATKWKWGITFNGAGKKMYATRSTRLHGRKGPQTKIYLHKEVLKRARAVPPSKNHTIGDHQDGDSLNNTRLNLRWATVTENNNNRFGSYARQSRLVMDEVPF